MTFDENIETRIISLKTALTCAENLVETLKEELTFTTSLRGMIKLMGIPDSVKEEPQQ